MTAIQYLHDNGFTWTQIDKLWKATIEYIEDLGLTSENLKDDSSPTLNPKRVIDPVTGAALVQETEVLNLRSTDITCLKNNKLSKDQVWNIYSTEAPLRLIRFFCDSLGFGSLTKDFSSITLPSSSMGDMLLYLEWNKFDFLLNDVSSISNVE